MITAPYNFVPLNKEVFYPSWSNDVSHDVPFSDGESGEIDITVTAKSPIFIRNHSDDRSKASEEFCQHNGEYYIPSSTIKGMVRNVLEIISFSKMRIESFNNDTYAVRDLSKADNFYMTEMKKPTFGGWLKKVGNSYFIEDCGEVGRIKHEEIDKALGKNFASQFKDRTFDKNDKKQKTSEYKYAITDWRFNEISLSAPYKSKTNAKYDNRTFYSYDTNGKNKATLILTGQPTPRKDSGKMGDGKGFEFLFFPSKGDIEVSEEVMDNFKFAYFDGRTTEPKESPDWTYWKEKLKNGEKIPVFFQKNGSEIKHFGLSYLYKLPYTHSVKDGIPASHFESNDLDLAQTIFGYISKNNKEALKGRVQFSHFKAVQNIKVLNVRKEILGTPRASYYPIYVKQQDGKLYKTFMDGDFEIAGRKRYPIHNSNQTIKTEDTGNENVGTTFTPLQDGVIFKGKLRYHNLKRAELGAILSALTFHNTPKTFHSIGMAKSLGYGKIELKIDGLNDINSYLKEFELTIGGQIENWSKSEQLQELLSMATEQQNSGNSNLRYMKLTEFAKNKTGDQQDYLGIYTSLNSIKKINPKSLLSEDDNTDLMAKREAIRQQIQVKIEEEAQQKANEEALEKAFQKQKAIEEAQAKKIEEEFQYALKSDNIETVKKFIERHNKHLNIHILKQQLAFLEKSKEESKFKELNEQAQKAYDNVMTQKDKNRKKQFLASWLKKWEDYNNNQGSQTILDLIEKVKNEIKYIK